MRWCQPPASGRGERSRQGQQSEDEEGGEEGAEGRTRESEVSSRFNKRLHPLQKQRQPSPRPAPPGTHLRDGLPCCRCRAAVNCLCNALSDGGSGRAVALRQRRGKCLGYRVGVAARLNNRYVADRQERRDERGQLSKHTPARD
jgi:hypothetical protein